MTAVPLRPRARGTLTGRSMDSLHDSRKARWELEPEAGTDAFHLVPIFSSLPHPARVPRPSSLGPRNQTLCWGRCGSRPYQRFMELRCSPSQPLLSGTKKRQSCDCLLLTRLGGEGRYQVLASLSSRPAPGTASQSRKGRLLPVGTRTASNRMSSVMRRVQGLRSYLRAIRPSLENLQS